MIRSKALCGVVICGFVLGVSSLTLAQAGGGGGRAGGILAMLGAPPTTADTMIVTIADMCLTGDLNLTADQKAKIKGIRATLDKARQPLRDLAKEMRDAMTNKDQDKLDDLRDKAADLRVDFKKASDQALKDLKVLFADDVQKKIDDRHKDLIRDLILGIMGSVGGGRGGGAGGGGN